MMKRFAVLAASALVVASCQEAQQPFGVGDEPQMGVAGQRTERVIVIFEPGTEDAPGLAVALTRRYGQVPSFVYETALQGFAADLPAPAAAALANHPSVAYVEPDRERSIDAQSLPTGADRTFATANANIGIDGFDRERVDVDVAIIDTGIDLEHPDLNVVGGVNCSGGGPFGGACKAGGDDDHYHGTHVGGTVGAIDNGWGVVGVAPGARLWAVKVLDQQGRGYASWIIAGIDWVAANAATIEVANMSLGGSGFSQGEYDAIQGAIDRGVAFAVAAGNSDADANDYSPAAFDNVLTVSALADFDGAVGGLGTSTCRTDQDDTLADFSNWGSAVRIAAPGVCILSTYPMERGEYGTISGTSMASPHVAGALALLASSSNPSDATDVNALYDRVVTSGNFDWNDDSGDGIFEPLLDVSDAGVFAPEMVAVGGDDGSTTDLIPTSQFSYACVELDCTFDGSGSSDDGSIASYAWDFGDGTGATGVTATRTYAEGATYVVTLTVTDDANQTGSSSQDVNVAGEPVSGAFTLTATGSKVKGVQRAELTWSGSTTTVDIYRDDRPIATDQANDGAYTDLIGNKGGGSYVYKVCETGSTTICSNTSTVTF